MPDFDPDNREKEIFEHAIEIASAEERLVYLRRVCPADAALLERIQALLRAAETAEDFLPEIPQGALNPSVPLLEKPGDRIGRYKLLHQIGEGGCGVVYMAEQEEPVRRRVALKVVKLGMDTREVIARFEAERQALAMMEHPNIAKALDAGATATGRPYFVMELVHGVKMTEYCDHHHLSTEARLKLFIQVCFAIQHAHQKGVIRRDIKPSNILVTLNDGAPMPKVIDFGIAKATLGKLTDRTVFTAFEQFIGTPAYMSPEQAEMSAQDIDTRSDIYSLGVLLYELLTGQTPFDATEMLRAGLDELRRQIREVEPARPSTRLSAMVDATLTTVAAQRQSAAPKLIHLVRGDLDWIVMKCLEKDRARRYETANGLALDLQRHLNNEPVAARPPGNVYQFQKLARRHKVVFVAACIVAITGILGLTGVFWQWRQARLNAQDAVKQKGIAEEDAAKTRLNLYAADIAVAAQVLQNGDLRSARGTLDGLRPKEGETDLRGFEWRYLWNLCRGQQLATLTGHERTVTCTAFSPDGMRLASGSMDGTVRIWDSEKHEEITAIKVSNKAVWSVAFTPDGKWLMTGSGESVEFRDADSWQVRTNFPGQLGALSKAGDFLATADSSPFFNEETGAVTLWNWRTGQFLRRLDRPGRALAFSADARKFAMVDKSWTITVCDMATGKLLREWPMKHPVWSLDFSPDGNELMASGWSREVSIRNISGAAPPRTFKSPRLTIWSANFSPDGATIATGGTDRRLRYWDAATLEPRATLQGHESEVWCNSFSPDGKLVATGGTDNAVMLWSTAANSPNVITHDGDFRPIFSPDGATLLTHDPAGQSWMLWDVATKTLLKQRLAGGQFIFGFSQDGKSVMTLDESEWVLHFWLPAADSPHRQVQLGGRAAGPARFTMVATTPAQDVIFAIDENGLIRTWDTATGHLLHSMQGPVPPIRSATMSLDGKRLAVSIDRENVVRLYDCGTGAERQLAGHQDFISGLSFSPDGKTLATGSMDGSIRLWKTDTGECLAALPAHMGETSDVAISPDGKTLASLGKGESLTLWHLPTLRQVMVQDKPQAGIYLRFSPDGRSLAVVTDTDKLTLLSAPADAPEKAAVQNPAK